VWILSGTLCPNHCGELYTHLHALFPKDMPQYNGQPINYHKFLDRFCEWESTQWGIKVTANKDSEVLRTLLRQVTVTRTREEIEAALPALTVATTHLARPSIDEVAYADFLQSDEGRALATALPKLEAGAEWLETAPLAAARHILGDLKANAVSNYARQLLLTDDTTRLLIFAHHHSVLRRIAFDLKDIEPRITIIDGTTDDARRVDVIRAFQDRAMRVLVLGIGTAREGITLTAANRVLFAEASWVPAHNDQAIHRAARIGQTRPVIAEYLAVTDTLDEAVMRTCSRKTRLLTELFD
jgi:SNF2 family DNA or RNA helicase